MRPLGRPVSPDPVLGFEAQTEKPTDPKWPPLAGHDVDACPASAKSVPDLTDAVFIPSSTPSCSDRTPCGSPMTPPGLFGSLGPSLLAFTLHRPWSIGVNLSLNLHHAPSTTMSHPSPAHHKPRATSYAPVLSITHHRKGANLPWFLKDEVEGSLRSVKRHKRQGCRRLLPPKSLIPMTWRGLSYSSIKS